jgi:hypothetical protein
VAIPQFAKVAAWAELRARTDGLRGSSSTWMAIWVLLSGYRYLKRRAAPDPVVIRERLEPGQQLIVTHFAKGAAPADPVASRRRRSRR